MMHDPLDPDVKLHRQKIEKERERTSLSAYIAEEIRLAREDAGMTQRDLAKKVGKSPSWISQLESPYCNPRLNDLQKVCLVLKLNLQLLPWPK